MVELGMTLPKYYDPPLFFPKPIVDGLPRPEFH
jgi:hypothetical protein